MKNFLRVLMVVFLAGMGVLADGCGDDDAADGDGGDASVDGDADTDSDVDSDSGSDGSCPCADSGALCPGYPTQCDWDLGKVVTNRTFSAVFGSGDDATELDMCEVFNNRDKVKSLVFAVGQQS